MQFYTKGRIVLLVMCALLKVAHLQPNEPLPVTIFDGIGNVANTATNFLNSAVERPRNLLIDATRATTGYIDSAASRGLEFKLRRFLEKFRTRMANGIPELGIPALEPLTLDEIDIVIDNPEIGNISLVIENLVLRKLSSFSINKAKLSLAGPTITVNVSIPEIYAEGRYNISGIVGDMFPLYGVGPFNATIYDFRIYVNTVLGYSRGVYMKVFDLDFSLGSVRLHLENFMGGEEIGQVMSQVFEELTPKAVDIIKPDILPDIQNYIASRANETIHHLTMRDIFIVLLGHNEIRDVAHLLVP